MFPKNCPLHRGFLKRILYKTNPFLKKCPLEGDVRYREVSLYDGWLRFKLLKSKISGDFIFRRAERVIMNVLGLPNLNSEFSNCSTSSNRRGQHSLWEFPGLGITWKTHQILSRLVECQLVLQKEKKR